MGRQHTRDRITRRQFASLAATGVAGVTLAGCTGSGDDDGSSPDNGGLTIQAADSFVAETEVILEDPNQADMVFETSAVIDFPSRRAYVEQTTREAAGGEPITFEWAMVDETRYQVTPEGSCSEVGVDIFERGAILDVDVPDPGAEPFADAATVIGTSTHDGIDVEVWSIDFDQTEAVNIGEMEVLVDSDQYLRHRSGWFSHWEDRTEYPSYEFWENRHSINEVDTVPFPEACEG